MSRTVLAFVISPAVAALFYWWASLVEYYLRVGVLQASPPSLLTFIVAFAYIGSLLVAVPVYVGLRSVGLASTAPLVASGTVVGWLFISFLDTGRPWLHPEAFATGLIAAAVFVVVRGKAQPAVPADANALRHLRG